MKTPEMEVYYKMNKMKLMKSTALAVAVLIYLSLTSCLIAGGNIVKEGRIYKAEVVNEFEVGAGGKLELAGITGDVWVDSWNENKIEIVQKMVIDVYTMEEAERIYDLNILQFEEKGKTITAYIRNGRRGNLSVTYYITLPQKFTADISTSGGDFNIQNLNGDYYFKTSGGDIEINSCQGEIECSTSGGDLELFDIKGKLYANTSGGDIVCARCSDQIELKTSGGEIELRELQGKIYAKTSGGDIEAIQINGELEVKTSGGEIVLEYITSSKLIDANTSGGDIEVQNIDGNLYLKTSGGDICAQAIKGNLEAKTSGGDIEICESQGNIEVATSGGDIEVCDAQGYIEAETSGGDIEVSLEKYIPKKDQHISLKSSGGEINLTLPKDFKASINALINIYGANFDEYEIRSDFTLKITQTSEESGKGAAKIFHKMYGTIAAEGDINGGGNRINLETTNGSIYIKKR